MGKTISYYETKINCMTVVYLQLYLAAEPIFEAELNYYIKILKSAKI
jgi:hypothetical protein